MFELEYKFWMWVIKMDNFQKRFKFAKMNFLKCAKKRLDLAKDITKEIKRDKIILYKYHFPQKWGIMILGAKWDPNALKCGFTTKAIFL